MPIETPVIDDLLHNYADLLLRLHSLLLADKEGDPKMDEVEDSLSIIWEKLSEAQRHSLNGMASDLNWMRRGGAPPPKGRKPEDGTDQERQLLAEAETRGDWPTALHYLRVCAPALDTQNLARRKAAAYAGLGLPVYAELCSGLGSALRSAASGAIQ